MSEKGIEEIKEAVRRMNYSQPIYFNKVIGSTPTKEITQTVIEQIPDLSEVEEAKKGPQMVQLKLKSGDRLPLWTQNLRAFQVRLLEDGTLELWYLRDFLNRVH